MNISTVVTPSFSFEGKQPSELEQRRREIVQSLTTTYKGYDDPDVPIELLHELAALTGTLRRRTSGPPKTAKAKGAKGAPKANIDDLLGQV